VSPALTDRDKTTVLFAAQTAQAAPERRDVAKSVGTSPATTGDSGAYTPSQTGRDLVDVWTSGTELIGGRVRCFVRRGRGCAAVDDSVVLAAT
jgi:hypothetical protein